MSNNHTTPREFRRGVERDAAAYLIGMVGEKRGREAAARVAMAFAAAARSARKPEALYECSRASVVSCIANCALTGLMPGGAHPKLWLVPKGGELQWWMSHRGIAVLALRAGYHIQAIPVHVEDHLRIEFGEVVEHEGDPDRWADKLEELSGVYVQTRRLSDGAHLGRVWLPVAAIKKRRAKAQTKNVWNEWPVEQAQKTAIKWAMSRGFLPIESDTLDLAVDAEPVFVDIPAADVSVESVTGVGALGLEEDSPVEARQLEDRQEARDIEAGSTREERPLEKVRAKPKKAAKRDASPERYANNPNQYDDDEAPY